MRINARQLERALATAEDMALADLYRTGGGTPSRSYWVRHKGKLLPMKAVLRLAYIQSKRDWNGPQSSSAARALRPHFDIVHLALESERARLERQREATERWARDSRFRTAVLELYGASCGVSGCTVRDAIDAAHILGVGDRGADDPANGLALRADLHRMFDNNLMAINPENGRVRFAADCRADYKPLEGKRVRLPSKGPSLNSFSTRWRVFLARANRD